MDIVVAYCEPWDTPLRTSKRHYLERMADQGHRVLYVEMPANPLSVARRPRDFFRRHLPRIRSGLIPLRKNIWAVTGFFPLFYHRGLGGFFDHAWLNAFNQRFFLRRLARTMRALDFDRPILLSYYPLILPVVDEINPGRVVFHMVDEWQGLAGIPRSMASLTRGMLERADVTIVSSRTLLERYRADARDIHLLRHGTDLELFIPVLEGKVVPDGRMLAYPGVRVGYYGALHKLDFDLIREVASQQPGWSFIFLGPVSGYQGIGAPPPLPSNVHLWDAWPRETLPGFLAGLDLFWMPFVRSELTDAMCPIKLFEALSAGIPVVSTDLDETRDVGGEIVEYARDAHGHLEAIEKALAQDDAERRKSRAAAVAGYDWSVRTAVFSELLLGSRADLQPQRKTQSR
jgi:glycosyltransferase involved in cell wall biosynthesis